MRDQADQLRQLVHQTFKAQPALEPGVPLVVVSGGTAGVGTTTVATQVVRELAQLGKRAVLVDAHPLQPEIANLLEVEVHGCLAEVLDGSRSAVEVLQPVEERVHLLPGRWQPHSPPDMSQEAIQRLFAELRSLDDYADVVIIDVGSGMSPWVQYFWETASQILLVTTQEPTAMMDSYAAVKLAPRTEVDGKVRLVINQCDDRPLAHHMTHRFLATCRSFLDMEIAPAPTVACRDELIATLSPQRGTTVDNFEFHQTIRLLAAEVISSCLVVSARIANRATSNLAVAPTPPAH